MDSKTVTQAPVELFISYSHRDRRLRSELDDHLAPLRREGLITTWHDRSIGAGREWEGQIDAHLNSARVILLLISPSFMASDYSYDREMRRAMQRHQDGEARVIPIILKPVNWQAAPFAGLQVLPEDGRAIMSRRPRDEALESVAASIRRAVLAFQGGPKPPSSERTQPTQKKPPRPRIKPTYVDQHGGGDFVTISEAIEAASPGDWILVRPGIYRENLEITKPLELSGYAPGEVEVRGHGPATLLFDATMGRVANLNLRLTGADEGYTVHILQGRLDLDGCDISSEQQPCVGIQGGADPRLRRNRIHHGRVGVLVYDGGRGSLLDNDIEANSRSGVEISTDGNPILYENRIHDNAQAGVFVWDSGLGTLIENDISRNNRAGVEIESGGNPLLLHNSIHDGAEGGVFVHDGGKGTLTSNEIFRNRYAGVAITDGAEPVLRRNLIHNGLQQGVFIKAAGGVFEENEIHSNGWTGVEVRSGSNPTLRKNVIHRGHSGGVLVADAGIGTFQGNEIHSNHMAGIVVDSGGQPTLLENSVRDGLAAGVLITGTGMGILERNQIVRNAHQGVEITSSGEPVLKGNVIKGNAEEGIRVHNQGSGTIEENDLRGNLRGAINVAPECEHRVKRLNNSE